MLAVFVSPPLSTLTSIKIPKVRCKRVTVWAKQPQVALGIVVRVPIDMIDLKRHMTSDRIAFVPSTDRAAFAMLF